METLLFSILENISIEQSISLLICFSLWYMVRSVSSIKKIIYDDKDRTEDFISEVKFGEERIYHKFDDFKQSNKDSMKKIITENIEKIDIPEDRTDEILKSLTKTNEEVDGHFFKLRKRNKDEIRLLELLRREIKEIREDVTDAEIIFPDYSKNIDLIAKEQSKKFNKLERQIDNINVNPIVKIPNQEQINIPNYEKDFQFLKERLLNLDTSIINMDTKIRIKENPSQSNIHTKESINTDKKLIIEWKEERETLKKALKQTEKNIINNISNQTPPIIKNKNQSSHSPINLPDFKQMNRDLLLQVEEAVSSRLEELNQNILNNRKSYSIEIQNTISQINKITEIVTSKLKKVNMPSNTSKDNNKEVLSSISMLSNELNNLKKQIASISREIPTPIVNIPESINIDQIEQIFNNGKEEIKTEIKKESNIINNNIDNIMIRLPLVEKTIISKLDKNIQEILSKMKTLDYTMSHIDITIKENQDKISMLFYNHVNTIKKDINTLKDKDINIKPIIELFNSKFDIIDKEFDSFLDILSKIENNGSKYDTIPESLSQIKHIFENDIVKQYQEQLLFLTLMGNKISELNTRKT